MSWLRRSGRTAGYVTAPAGRGRRWHTDRNCPESTWPKRPRGRRVTLRADTALTLARDMGARGITACRCCALPAILDEVAAGAPGPGYHVLICGSLHISLRIPGACPRCAVLTAYATRNGALSADTSSGHGAVLRPGLTTLAPDALAVLGLDVQDASGDLPAITAPMWAFAAKLLPTHNLTKALAAAAALYADPADGGGP